MNVLLLGWASKASKLLLFRDRIKFRQLVFGFLSLEMGKITENFLKYIKYLNDHIS